MTYKILYLLNHFNNNGEKHKIIIYGNKNHNVGLYVVLYPKKLENKYLGLKSYASNTQCPITVNTRRYIQYL